MDILQFLGLIDWTFAVVLLLGGRYFGSKYFSVTRNAALNFLFFASAIGVLWIIVLHFAGYKVNATSLFVTYLFTTSFYELLAKKLFEKIEEMISKG